MAVIGPGFFAASFAVAFDLPDFSFALSWASDGPTPTRPAARARASMIRSVRIYRPPVDERESQAAGRVERVAGVEQQVGDLARLDRTVSLPQPEDRGGPGGECFEGREPR